MPWKERSVMDEGIHFVIRLKDGETMASLCREFGISRKTGYKVLERYEECGWEGLTDRARRPHRYANALPEQVEAAIVRAEREKPSWGARKIRERLLRRLPHEVKVPACSTIHAILGRQGLVTRAKRSRTPCQGTPLSAGLTPNALWCADYKGEFKLGNGKSCYPLTVPIMLRAMYCCAKRWNPTRNGLLLPPLSGCSKSAACRKPSAPITAFRSPHPTVCSIFPNCRSGGCAWASRSNALSPAIRSRMAGTNACISREERSHTARGREPAAAASQVDAFLEDFNKERPHEALQMKCPAEVYRRAAKPYKGIGEWQYPFHDKTIGVTNCGRLCLYRKKINLSTCLADQAVGIKEVDDGIWLVSFMHYDLGYIDLEEKTLQPLDNPFGPKPIPADNSVMDHSAIH